MSSPIWFIQKTVGTFLLCIYANTHEQTTLSIILGFPKVNVGQAIVCNRQFANLLIWFQRGQLCYV